MLLFFLAVFLGISAASDAAREDADKIAFVVQEADWADAPTDIYVIDADGTGRRNLTRSALLEYDPVWSPDGRLIAFNATRTYLPASQIFVMNADGTSRRRLTQSVVEGDYSFVGAWSPDGRRIAYTRSVGGNIEAVEVYVMNADGSGKRRLTRNKRLNDTGPRWSPDGKWIHFYRSVGPRSAGEFAVSVDGRRQRRVRATAGLTSPNRRHVALNPTSPGPTFHTNVVVANADGTNRRRVTRGIENHLGPWSPDSRFLLIISRDDRLGGLLIYAVSTDRVTRLTDNDRDGSPQWSRDGTRIVFVRGFELWTIKRDGTGARPLARPVGEETYSSPAWSP